MTKLVPGRNEKLLALRAAYRESNDCRLAISAAKPNFTRKLEGRFAFVVDATGSMSSFIEETKRDVGWILRRIFEESGVAVEMQMIAYRDYENGEELLESSVLSGDERYLQEWLADLRCEGGCDWQEAVQEGLQVAANGDFSAVFLAGDARSHDKSDLKRKQMSHVRCARDHAADFGQRKIPIYAFLVGDDRETERDFKEIADLSGGSFGRLDGTEAMRNMAVMGMLTQLKGREAVGDYLAKNAVSQEALAFGKQLMLEDQRGK